MSARSSHPARLEDAIVERLERLHVDGHLDRFDLKAAPAQDAGWKSLAPIACRVIWMGTDYPEGDGVGGELQQRKVEIVLSWRFKQLRTEGAAYAYLEAALVLLNGWKPPLLGDRLMIRSEKLVDVVGGQWDYEQRFQILSPIAVADHEEILAAYVTRITKLDVDGGDLSPPVDVFDEGGGA